MTETFPTVDFHALTAAQGIDLTAAFSELRAYYVELDRRNAANTKDLDLPCHQGCDACCHECVFLTPLEFFFVWDWVQQNFSDTERAAVIRSGLALYNQHRDLIDAFDRPPPNDDKDHFAIAKQLHFACPLLNKLGGCSVYPVRELYARLFGCSFNDEPGEHDDAPGAHGNEHGVYGCHLVSSHLAGKSVTLVALRPAARRLSTLPLTHKRQVYPYYLHALYGAE